MTNLRIKYVTETKTVSVLFYKNLFTLRFLYILGSCGPRCAAPLHGGGGSSVKEILVAKQWSNGPNSFSRPLGTRSSSTPKKSDHRIYQSKWRIFSSCASGLCPNLQVNCLVGFLKQRFLALSCNQEFDYDLHFCRGQKDMDLANWNITFPRDACKENRERSNGQTPFTTITHF